MKGFVKFTSENSFYKQFLFSLVLSLCISILPQDLRAQQKWQMTGNGKLYAGQYFFNRGAGSVNGLADVDLQLAHSFSPESGYFFDGHSVYTGFKQVDELAGGGTLFQQSWDNSLGFKWIKRYEGGVSLKPRIGVTSELFRETNDEGWGSGLFDFVRYEAGAALERKTRWSLSVPWTYQFSYDFYYTHYPHFTSLASSPLGAALGAPNPGAHVLDTVTNQLTYRSDFDLPGFASLWGMYSLALVDYTDAKVVNTQDQYLDAMRSDAYQTLSVGCSKRLTDLESLGRIRPVVGVGIAVNDLFSNQNNFDTQNGNRYIGSDFDYWEAHLSPSVEATFLRTMIRASLAYDVGYRVYTGRLTQNPDGTYNNSRLQQVMHNVVLETAYPVGRLFENPWMKGLELKARGIYGAWSSNTRYQQAYVYSYTSWNYFAGVEWKL